MSDDSHRFDLRVETRFYQKVAIADDIKEKNILSVEQDHSSCKPKKGRAQDLRDKIVSDPYIFEEKSGTISPKLDTPNKKHKRVSFSNR